MFFNNTEIDKKKLSFQEEKEISENCTSFQERSWAFKERYIIIFFLKMKDLGIFFYKLKMNKDGSMKVFDSKALNQST